jgi:hypothetical protein
VKVIKVTTWDVYKVNGSPAGFLTPSLPGKDPRIEDEVICDPIQKNVADCFFIAALGSCAWNTTLTVPQIPIKPANNFAPSFTIPFYQSATAQPTLITVLNTLPLDARGIPIYAQPTPSQEIWVAIYEKAFAKFKGCTQDAVGNPNISELPSLLQPGSALSVLTNLTKKKFSFDPKSPPQTACTTNPPSYIFNGQTYADYFEIIKTGCTPNPVKPSFGKTKYPMVAWTYDSESFSPWNAQGLRYRYPTTNLDRMLLAKHTYSILGYYISATGSKYIVLKDPLGGLGATPQTDTFIKTYLPLAPASWDPVQDHTKCSPRDISLYPCGIFGLRVDAFTNCFSGFGWVQ